MKRKVIGYCNSEELSKPRFRFWSEFGKYENPYLKREKHCADLKGGGPLVLQDVEADAAKLVDVGVVDGGQEAHLCVYRCLITDLGWATPERSMYSPLCIVVLQRGSTN